MSKYIIDIPDSVKKIVYFHVGNANAIWTTSNILDDLEELNSDYINEHFGDLQDTAYQRGLEDAWEAARKIAAMWETMDNDDLLETFGVTAKIGEYVIGTLFKKQTANEAMLKLEAYEEKQKADDKIERGDIVNVKGSCNDDLLGVVTKVWEDNCYITWGDGSGGAWCKKSVVKTGKHIDVDKFLGGLSSDN